MIKKKVLKPGLVSVSMDCFRIGKWAHSHWVTEVAPCGPDGMLRRGFTLKRDSQVNLIRTARSGDILNPWEAPSNDRMIESGMWWLAEIEDVPVWISERHVITTLRK
jgi:hypothetical protein